MNLLLFGATGMVGHGVLRECLFGSWCATRPNDQTQPVPCPALQVASNRACGSICRTTTTSRPHSRRLLLLPARVPFRMKERAYERVIYRITMAAATALSRLYPKTTFVYGSRVLVWTVRNWDAACGHASRARRKTPSCACRSRLASSVQA